MERPTLGNGDEGKIEHLQDRLYSRAHPVEFKDERSKIDPKEVVVEESWKDEPIDTSMLKSGAKRPLSAFNKLFIGSLAFFLVCLAVAGVFLLGGFNRLSPKNVDISVVGPVSTAAGSELSLDVVVQNNNAMDLEDVSISIQYPQGARNPLDLNSSLTVERQNIGPIAAGKSARRTVRAVLFGEKDAVQDIKVTATYKIRTTSTEFSKEKLYHIAITSSPVIMTIDYPKEVDAGQEFAFDIDLASNTNTDLENVILKLEFPFGFVYKGSDPGPYAGNDVWKISTLKALEKRRFTVKGVIEAQDNEERTFRFFAGKSAPDDDRKIGVNLTTSSHSVTVKKPGISLDMQSSGRPSEGGDSIGVIGAGEYALVSLIAKNNLPYNVENAELLVKVSGPILARETISATNNGYFKSLDNTVVWNRNTSANLVQIEPGAFRSMNLGFSALRATKELISSVQNPEIQVDAEIKADWLASDGLPQTITVKRSGKVKVSSEMRIMTRSVYSVGPFANTGPVPPKVDTETTYTVIWSVTNSFNNVSGAVAKSTLPPFIEWKDQVSPSTERMTYNPITREIQWNLGDLKRGVGYLMSPREVAFQVSVVPSLTQVGGVLNLISDVLLTGRDNFTGSNLAAGANFVSTAISSDPQYMWEPGHVVR